MTQVADNGWPHITVSQTVLTDLPEYGLKIRTVNKDVAALFVRLITHFDQEVQSVRGKQLDDWSYADRKVRDSTTALSCHATGTAIDLNALQHVRGVRNTFTSHQVAAIRRILARFKDQKTGLSIFKWGGDFHGTVDEMHWQIQGDKAAVKRVIARIKAEEEADDMQWTDKIKLTAKDAEIWGTNSATGKVYKEGDEVTYGLMVRYPTLARKLEKEVGALADSIEALAKLVKART